MELNITGVEPISVGITGPSAGGSEPDEYLKSAAVSGNVLTLTKKDDTTVVYEPTSTVTSVNGKTGAVTLYGTDIYMSSDPSLPTVTEQISSNKTNIGELTTEMADKQDKLTAGTNITIDANNVISATGGGGGSYSAGTNIVISNNEISTDTDVVFDTIQTGTSENNYFQCQKFRGEGDADSYYHAIDFGYAGHNQVDFYDYGGTYTFYECTSGEASTATELLQVTPSDITYKGTSLLGGGGGGVTSIGGATGAITLGSNLTISGNQLSAIDTTYTAGTGISITNGVISCTFPNGDEVSY